MPYIYSSILFLIRHTILLWDDYDSIVTAVVAGLGAAFGLVFLTFTILLLVLSAIICVCHWKLFEKAGKPGWTAIVPFYNTMVMLEISGKPISWIGLMLIPYIGIIWAIWGLHAFVKSFGKDVTYTVGIIFLPFIFLPLMAFDKKIVYIGPGGVKAEVNKPSEEDQSKTS